MAQNDAASAPEVLSCLITRLLVMASLFYALLWGVFLMLRVLEGPDPFWSWSLAIKLAPWSSTAQFQLGEVLRNDSEACPAECEAAASQPYYRRAVRLNPRFAEAHMWLGWTYAVGKDPRAAKNEFDIAERLQPRLKPEVEDLRTASADADSPAGIGSPKP